MKKRFTSMLLAVIMVFSLANNAFASNFYNETGKNTGEDNCSDDVTVSESTTIEYIILEESCDMLYNSIDTGLQESSIKRNRPGGNVPVPLNIKHSIIQGYGGQVDLNIYMVAGNFACGIKSVSGSMECKDLTDGFAVYQEFYKSTLTPTFSFDAYIDGDGAFEIGHTVQVSYDYYIRLVNGEVLNGGHITGTETIVIKR